MIFEISVIVLVGLFLLVLHKLDNKVLRRFGLAFAAVLLFEYFTQALWLNKNLEPWSYLYLDVSWILTIGWAGIITVIRGITNLYLPTLLDKSKFFVNLILISIIGFFAEWVVLGLGIRSYSEAVQNTLSGITIGPVPIEAIYYVPVFMSLVISFNLYWEYQLNIKESKSTRKTTK